MSTALGLQPNPPPICLPAFSSCNSRLLALPYPVASVGKIHRLPRSSPPPLTRHRLHLRRASPPTALPPTPARCSNPSISLPHDGSGVDCHNSGNDGWGGGGGGGGGGGNHNNNNHHHHWWRWWHNGNPSFGPDQWWALLPLLLLFSWGGPDEGHFIVYSARVIGVLLISILPHVLFPSLALGIATGATAAAAAAAAAAFVWEVTGGRRTKLVVDPHSDSFVVDRVRKRQDGDDKSSSFLGLEPSWHMLRDLVLSLLLPEGYPHSVSSDYLEYSLWRGVQGVASQISGVLSTQALLYAIGLGKGAIPSAAALNWVLKDGIGYLSKILLSNFGRHFDVNPKGWRLFADMLENLAYGFEILTPAFPQYFVLIGAAAGAVRSAAALIQASTRSCFYAGFAVQRNFAEVIAKGEAQGMVSKFIGIMLGIALGNYIGSSTPLALASFSAVTGLHMYCNFKSYQSIQLRTLNPYRACLVFSEYLLSGQVPLIKEVNEVEPFFPGIPILDKLTRRAQCQILSMEAKDAASEICRRLQVGSKLSGVINSKEDASSLFNLFRNEGYLLTVNRGRYCIILQESCSPDDMLKAIFQVSYLYWLEKNVDIKSGTADEDCRPGGKLQISLEYVQREYRHVKSDGLQRDWVTDGLIARPLPNRIRLGY